ncbi:MAG: hypothetical protein KF813_03335 [Trueperaceae bacterium]|nr:hypothetical protein [Trueperaceae bacterium]
MTKALTAFSCSLTLLLAGSVLAQTIDASSEEFLMAATVVTTFDHFMESCDPRTLSASEAAELDAWQQANAVQQMRDFLAAEDPQRQGLVWEIRDELASEFTRRGITGCLGALSVVDIPQADLRSVAPSVIAALSASPASSTPTPPTPTGAVPLADHIDSFAFDAKYGMGFGGFMTVEVVPVVLFTSGDALLKIDQLSRASSIEEGRRLDPEAWTRWRRQGGEIQVERSAGWENLPFSATYAALPAGFQLSGRYLSLGGGGDIAFGGTTSVAAWTEYTFLPGGVVVRGGGAGGQSEFAGASVAVASLPADQRGRYEVDGIMLRMAFDDGATFSYVLVTDPDDEGSVIWLDGVAYSPR